jgi:hypothetical protein
MKNLLIVTVFLLASNAFGALTKPTAAMLPLNYHSATTQIYNGTSPTGGYTALDLSSIIGANKALVFLRVSNADATNVLTVAFRRTSDTVGVGRNANDSAGGGTSFASINPSSIAYITMEADASGIVQWYAWESRTTVIHVIGYVK